VTYRLVIFDFDGTLADTFPWFVSVIDEVADKFQFQRLPKEKIEALRRYDARELLKSYDVPLWKVPMIARHLKGLMARDRGQIELFAGADLLLRRLTERGIKVALASSNSYENVTGILGPERTAMIADFECGVSIFGKAAKLRKIVRRNGVEPAATLCIGDEIRDIEAARDAKVAFGAVTWGYTCAEALAARSPEVLFSSMDEILSALCTGSSSAEGPAEKGPACRKFTYKTKHLSPQA